MIIRTTSEFGTRKLAEDEKAKIWEDSVPRSEVLNLYLRAESDLKIVAALIFMLEKRSRDCFNIPNRRWVVREKN